MIASDLIKASIRLIGAYAPGETPPSEDLNDGLSALNLMLDSWFADRTLVYAVTKESFPLVAGQSSYTIGTSGNFNTTRPFKIEGAYIRDSNNQDSFVEVTDDQNRYNLIGVKSTQGRPYILLYDPQMSTGKIYLYYTPDTTYTLYLDSWKPVTQVSSLSTSLTFPPGYERAIKYNLAIELAPEYGTSVKDEVAYLAKESKKEIQNLNTKIAYARFGDIPNTVRSFDIKIGY
jgi:hypothetical protein